MDCLKRQKAESENGSIIVGRVATMLLRSVLWAGRSIQTAAATASAKGDSPGEILQAQIVERERKRRQSRDSGKDEFFVQVQESAAWLDTTTLPMVLTAIAVALVAKVLMMELNHVQILSSEASTHGNPLGIMRYKRKGERTKEVMNEIKSKSK